MPLISMFCDVCGGDKHERDHAYKCRPTESPMTTPPTAPSREGMTLEPCPLCGGACQVRTDSAGFFAVFCVNETCGCALGDGFTNDGEADFAFAEKHRAIAAWNRRTPPTTGS